jgi:hypothetical protein
MADKSFLVDDDDENTPVTDLASAFAKISEVSVTTRFVAEAIGELKDNVDLAKVAANEASQHSEITRARLEDVDKRVERIEANGHTCMQIENIANIKKAEAQVTSKLSKFLSGVAVAAVSVVLAVVGGSWAISGQLSRVSSGLVAERELRIVETSNLKDQYNDLNKHLSAMPSKEDVTSPSDLTDMIGAIEENGNIDCEELSISQKTMLRDRVDRGILPRRFDCS